MKSILLALACVSLLCAQQRKLTVDPSSDEGKLLDQIAQQQDTAKKQQLMEEYATRFPKSPGLPWLAGQLQRDYLAQQQWDKTIELGELALAVDPDVPDLAYNNLKASEGKKDADLVRKWSAITSAAARKIVAANKTATEDDRKELDYARQLDIYTEYSLYALALQETDPAKAVALSEALEQRNPKSEYLPKVYGKYLLSLKQAGQGDRAGQKAEQIASVDASNEDILMIAADYNFQKKTEPAKVVQYATWLVTLLEKKQKPEGLTDDEWKKKRDSLLGVGYWMAGVTYSAQSQYAEADKNLRASLPYLSDSQLRGIGLFNLGLADYQLGRASKNKTLLVDALKFSEESAGLQGPMQAQAQKNVRAIRGELGK